MAKIFYTPEGFSGNAELNASNGLGIINQGLWQFSKSGYNDGATFGLSLTYPKPLSGGELHLKAINWPIAIVGNELTSYTDPVYGLLPASQCRILITGNWQVIRQQNSNSFVSFGVDYAGHTLTDLGGREMIPYLLNYFSFTTSYVIQGANVTGGAVNTFSTKEFFVRCTEQASSENSNKEFQSNTIIRPVFAYSYSKSWEIDV